ncbi:hypothetical protein [Roseovarius sp. M141]|uniref:hypothetical protein n=1 Tax=Roseovarius sp. M141 TaxID=2583806 RepID=UPI0020CE4964|nr:hypothetical protein [Roseovarius sp. M141]MCQ0094178.1 hypothetical protein [Roseovarius sp. M141]
MTKLAPIAGALVLLSASPALAWEYGPFAAEFSVEIENDTVVDSSDPAIEFSDTYATIEAAITMALGASSSLNLALTFEPIIDATGDRVFEDHGLYAEEFFFAHDFGAGEIILGKFNPAFGIAWDEAPGIFGADFAEDYQLTEQIGGAVLIPFAIGASENVVSVALFNADRSVLSKSLGRRRGPGSLLDGGVGNTSGPDSITITMAGELGATTYSAGVQNLARGAGDTHDQRGAVVGATHTYDLGRPVELLAEMAYFTDFAGTSTAAKYGSVGLAAPFGPVTVSGVYASRKLDGARIDHLATVTGEMELATNVFASLGYRYGREGADKTHTIGTVIAYEF